MGNCDNTSDVDKPISTAQSAEFTRLEGLITAAQGDTNGHSARTDNPHNVTAEQIGLGNCDNTSDANKPISTATQTALDKKADLGDDGLVLASQLPSTIGWSSVTDKPTEFVPSVHASTHASSGTDPISLSDIGAVAQSDFETLQNKVNALAITDFVLTDATTGTQYTIGVDNGAIVLNEVQ